MARFIGRRAVCERLRRQNATDKAVDDLVEERKATVVEGDGKEFADDEFPAK